MVAAVGTASGFEWLPAARPLPDVGRALDLLVTAPLTEEAFFRAWLLRSADRVGVPPAAGLAASALFFSLWHTPGGASEFFFFAALGLWLALLYRKSDGSLPLVAGTHASFNLIVVLLRAVRA